MATKKYILPVSEYVLDTYDEACRRQFADDVNRWLGEHGAKYSELARIAAVHWESVRLAATGGVVSMQSFRRIRYVIDNIKE